MAFLLWRFDRKLYPRGKSLPLEGKVPNECEADEVVRESLQQRCGNAAGNATRQGTRHRRCVVAARRCHLISRLTPTASPRGEACGSTESGTFAAKASFRSESKNAMSAPQACVPWHPRPSVRPLWHKAETPPNPACCPQKTGNSDTFHIQNQAKICPETLKMYRKNNRKIQK